MSLPNRRQVLQQALKTSAAYAVAATSSPLASLAAPAADAAVSRPRVSVLLNESIGTIKPAIYGQFLEHIGGVIYDGVWVGPDSPIPNTRGIRQEIIDHVKRLGPVVSRWPGGCFADAYHWRDGIGPRDKRPRRYGRWQEDTESNQFGTHEFMDFCRLTGTEPYFAANVGTGSETEFQNWVEYCNAPAGATTIADERVANGDSQPFGIKMWGVGNESWGCGGKFVPEDYCTEYRNFTEWVPKYGVPLYLIAAGPNGNDLDWTRRFFKKWVDYHRAPLHGWAAHYYCGTTGHALEFTRDQWFEMLFKADQMEKLIVDQWAAMGEFDPKHTVKLVIDEWGCWHPAGTEINPKHLFEQMSCLRDALVTGLTLDTFNRHADKVDMTNVAQLVNNLHSLFLADGDKFVATPNFHVFEMYRPHQQGKAVRIEVEADPIPFKMPKEPQKVVQVAGSASVTGKTLTLTLVHTGVEAPVDVAVSLRDGQPGSVAHTVLTHKDLSAHNTFDTPQTVVPALTNGSHRLAGAGLIVTLPPASVNRLDISLV